MIVLDSNVLWALMRPEREEKVVAWANRQPPEEMWTTAISVLEIRSGLLRLPVGRRATVMAEAFHRLVMTTMAGRILAFDLAAAESAASIAGRRIAAGVNKGTLDTQIAGIVVSRRATLATRNLRDFADLPIPLVDPWTA